MDQFYRAASSFYVEYCKGNRRWVSLRSGTHKYNYYYGGAYKELYDIIELFGNFSF